MLKRFLINILVLLIPLSIIMLMINTYKDCGFIINDRSTEIAKILVSGNNAAVKFIPTNWGNLQTSIVEQQLIQGKVSPKKILVFGTSRSSEINSDLFPGNTFFNCVLPAGTILDYIALYGLYKRNGLLPKYLIISIDPWTFHSRRSIVVNKITQNIADSTLPLLVGKELLKDYYYGSNYLGISKDNSITKPYLLTAATKIIELFNPDYFQLNLKNFRNKMVIRTDKDYVSYYFLIRSDGGYSLALQSEIDSNLVIEKSREFVKIHKSNFFLSSDTNTIYFEYFKKLVINLIKEDVTPVVYISPVNPYVFDNLSGSKEIVLEKKMEVFCKDNKILLVGSFNPHKYGYDKTKNFFIDAYHPVKSVVNSIFFRHKIEFQNIGIDLRN